MGGFLGVERNIGLSVVMGNAVDVNDTFFLGEKAGENVGTAAADEAFDFEERFLAGDGQAGSTLWHRCAWPLTLALSPQCGERERRQSTARSA